MIIFISQDEKKSCINGKNLELSLNYLFLTLQFERLLLKNFIFAELGRK
jgi:hypothetical protein